MMGLISRIRKTFKKSDRASTAPMTSGTKGSHGPTAGSGAQHRPHSSFSGASGGTKGRPGGGGTFQGASAAARATPQGGKAATTRGAPAAGTAAATPATDPSFAARRKKFDDLVPVIGEAPINSFCSRKWQERVEGLDTVGRMLRAKMHAKRVMSDDAGISLHFENVSKLVERALGDKVTPVYFATIDLLNVVLDCALPASKEVILRRLGPIIPGLLKWMTVSNSRVQEKTLRLFVDMANNEKIGVEFLAPYILKPITHKNAEVALRVHESRMTVLLGVLPVAAGEFFPTDKVMGLVLPPLRSEQQKLRNMGVAVAAEQYRHHGREVRTHTRHLDAEVMRELDKKFTAIDKAKAAEKAAEEGDDSGGMDDDPLWLLRIQRGPGTRAAGPGAAARVRGAGYRSGGSGAGGAGAGAGAAKPAGPRFKGHDWSKGPPIPRPAPTTAATGVDTRGFVAGPKVGEATERYIRRSVGAEAAGGRSRTGSRTGTSGAKAGTSDDDGDMFGATRPTSGPSGATTPWSRSSSRGAPSAAAAPGGFGAAAGGGGGMGMGGGRGYGTGSYGAGPAVPSGAGSAFPPPSGRGSTGGGAGARRWGTGAATKPREKRSVFANTGAAATFGTTQKTAAAAPESSHTSGFMPLPNLGGPAKTNKRGMSSADEAMMNNILNDL